MPGVLAELSPVLLVAATAIALLAGVIKGLVGFAMPMVLISGLGSLIAPELALAGLILPTLVTNGFQALAQGPRAAVASVRKFRVFLLVGLVMMLGSAQLVARVPGDVLLLMIGAPITLFAVIQVMGWQPRVAGEGHRRLEIGIGALAGLIGGFSGIWGPPTVAYLTALGTEKHEQIRVQGVIYGLGAVALAVAHIGSGVLNGASVWLSLWLVPPALLGMWLGGRVRNRIDQRAFRRATLLVLLLAGLNIVRRALT
ncbi:sulfite exporter TauE/SafE family protein [Maliponia aquimaris]|uniref:Probable membrane transporter protein n=1 Tax=Maliponia aquimaris TaxID=1673631 RepID=A0A238KDP3_9RHOB|nr:sulfite exporter TauE/SafE family protein [Maliponia aquimaris]SMX40292.1 Sulfite exporter TauE/SafE [Maliponia aquimaris]